MPSISTLTSVVTEPAWALMSYRGGVTSNSQKSVLFHPRVAKPPLATANLSSAALSCARLELQDFSFALSDDSAMRTMPIVTRMLTSKTTVISSSSDNANRLAERFELDFILLFTQWRSMECQNHPAPRVFIKILALDY